MDDIFSRANLVHAVSGASGSVISLTLFYPLDSLRTHLQVIDHATPIGTLKEIIQKEGVRSLYKGWYAVICSICCSNFVYFYTYTALKKIIPATNYQPLKDLASAFIAGCVNVFVTTPLWVANTRLKLQGSRRELHEKKHDVSPKEYSGLTNCLIRILKEEGIAALWSGTFASLILVCAPTVHFIVYEILKRYGEHYYNMKNLPGMYYFVIGGVAKVVSTLCTYPLQVVQSRMRAGFNRSEKERQSFLWILRLLLQNGGIRSLYKGLETKMVQTVLTTAFMFLCYEKIVLFVNEILLSK